MLEYLNAGWGWQFAKGLGASLFVAFSSFLLSILIGICCTLVARSGFRASRHLVNLYTYAFRSLPDVLLLILIFYSLDGALASVLQLLPATGQVKISPFLPAILSAAIVLGAYATEVFRAGWADIAPGQHEAGHSLGLSRLQSFGLIILPQVYHKIIPYLGVLLLISMKETALLSIVGIPDIVRTASIGARSTGAPFVFYGVAIAVFVAFAILTSALFKRLEGRSRQYMGGI